MQTSDAHLLSFAIRVSTRRTSSKQQYQIIIEHREGRGLIENPDVIALGRNGFALRFNAADGLVEQLGYEKSPIPLEVIDALKQPQGVLFINVDDDGEVVDGQFLKLGS